VKKLAVPSSFGAVEISMMQAISGKWAMLHAKTCSANLKHESHTASVILDLAMMEILLSNRQLTVNLSAQGRLFSRTASLAPSIWKLMARVSGMVFGG
jgi:hypothetical protein